VPSEMEMEGTSLLIKVSGRKGEKILMERITINKLYDAVYLLNRAVSPEVGTEQFIEHGLKQVGWFVLDASTSGYRLCQVVNSGGGQRDLTPRIKAKEVYYFIIGYRKGIENEQLEI
jgi:hypothetical protein|tara:strand:+ start:253 stop:603 length:351 start_codon:yes stop_codon:yes gene_type:complete